MKELNKPRQRIIEQDRLEDRRKQAEEALRESANYYRTLLENLPQKIFLKDENSVYLSCNENYSRDLKIRPDEIMGKIDYDFYPKELAKKYRADDKRIMESGKTEDIEERYIQDGKEVIVHTVKTPIKDEKGKIVAILGIFWDITERKHADDELKKYRERLEELVEERTAELRNANEQLQREITERKQAEKALRESERRYRTLFEGSRDAIYITSREGEILDANHFMLDLFSYSREEMLGLNARKAYVYSEDRIKFQQEIERNGFVRDYEMKLRKKDGTEMDCLLTADVRHADDGSILGYQGIIRDITELKQIVNELQTEKQRFQTLSENAPFGMVMIDKDGTFRYMNPKFRELFGYDLNDVPDGRTWFRKAYPDPTYRHNVISTWVNDLDSSNRGEKRPRTFTVTCKDGTKKIINFTPVQLETGENLMACEDITERKQAEEALRESEEKYRSILENIQDGYIEVDLAGNFTFVNGVVCRRLGYSREELIGMNNRQYTDETTAKKAYQLYNRVYRTGEPVRNFEEEVIRKDGTRWIYELSVSLIRNPEGKPIGFQGISRDITERKRAEKEMAALQEQLRESQKMEAIGRLAGGIAHDFNNLLTVIKGYSQLSLMELKEGDPLKGNIEEIQKGSQRAADLTRQLLAFSRRQVMEMKVLDLNTLLRDLDKMLRRIIGEDIELTTLLANDLGRVKIDPGQIEQVIMNLAVNAKDAMPSGGKLTIETANAVLDESYARNHADVKPGRYVMFSVSDTGVGMTPEVRERLFEPFFTTKQKGRGTGLGLSTVYGIVKQSGGNIWVYSEPGHGTTFKIYLSRVDEPLEQLREKTTREELLRGSETVLVVEDEEKVRQLTVEILGKQGYSVLDASQGDDALAISEKHKGPIHLILVDVVMPGISGTELTKRLAFLRPETKILYMSGYTDNAIVHHGVLEKGVNYIQKPFTIDELTRKVREALDK
ncbi:MAG: PAS domain S-box protein [Thermodesulfobacteriota bacterium]|jgi:PAS domain S-box-containing protein